jgi:sigma-B regulation protein RsbU (phosphoserine phosphatase)
MTTNWNFLTGEPERDQRNVSILLESVEALYGTRELDELMELAVDRAIEVTGAERGLLLVSEEEGELRTRVARGRNGEALPIDTLYSRNWVGRVWSSGQPSVTMDAPEQANLDLSESMHSLRLISLMAAPMLVKGRNVGVLYVDSTAKVREFTRSDLSVFQALAGLVALAVENARLNAEKAEQDRIKRELAVAREIQQRLLPANLPQPAGFDLAGVGRSCDETSGDYYDAIPTSDGALALVVGDVSGHGLGPALFMASTRALIHSALQVQPGLQEVMRGLNVFLERDMPDNAFMSMFLASLEPETGLLSYVSAGHNPPFLLRASGSLEELDRTGPVLGVLASAPYDKTETRRLCSGDVLMLYTDGIYEAHDLQQEMYGEERLQASLLRHAAAGASAADILAGVLQDLDAFVGEAPLEDDVTALVVRAL